MVKLTGVSKNGKLAVVLGLSKLNCDKLLEGKPIFFLGDEIGIPGISVTIVGGEDEQKIVESLKKSGLNITNTSMN
jgi:hypothetical protein